MATRYIRHDDGSWSIVSIDFVDPNDPDLPGVPIEETDFNDPEPDQAQPTPPPT